MSFLNGSKHYTNWQNIIIFHILENYGHVVFYSIWNVYLFQINNPW